MDIKTETSRKDFKETPESQTLNSSEVEPSEPIVYDYMKYPNKKKNGRKHVKHMMNGKNVSFKNIVEEVTFTDDWKMMCSQCKLRTEEEQLRSSNAKRNS